MHHESISCTKISLKGLPYFCMNSFAGICKGNFGSNCYYESQIFDNQLGELPCLQYIHRLWSWHEKQTIWPCLTIRILETFSIFTAPIGKFSSGHCSFCYLPKAGKTSQEIDWAWNFIQLLISSVKIFDNWSQARPLLT
jgi:hypothetical protein